MTMREPYQDQNGFTFMRTELGQVIVGRDACPEALAVADLDGDGFGDLLAIESPGYDYASQTLVALHGPSGRIVWRALEGQIGKRLALSDGVVVVEGADEASLFGVEARTGRTLWSIRLPGKVLEDPYGKHQMTWNAPALTDCGAYVAFGCEDGSVHAVESKSGRFAVSRRGRLLEHGHGIRGVVLFVTEEDGKLDLWDVERSGSILKGAFHTQAPLAVSPEGTLYLFHAESLPNGVPMTQVAALELASKRPLRKVRVTPGKGNVLPHNALLADAHRLAALGGERLILVSDDEERGGGIVIDLNAPPSAGPHPSVVPVSRMPPPQPGYKLRLVERFATTVVLVWEHEKHHRLLALGYDLATLEPRWFIGDAGGTALQNHALRTETALFLPFSLSGKGESKPGLLNHWAHIDPATGAVQAQYGVHELDCVRMHGKYLLAHATSFPPPSPVVWDTERRERVL